MGDRIEELLDDICTHQDYLTYHEQMVKQRESVDFHTEIADIRRDSRDALLQQLVDEHLELLEV